MIVRINQEFSDPLPVFGGCPQGSLLGVFLFNISTDDVELAPEEFLQETTDSVRVGDFFDEHDTEFLRQNESLSLNVDPNGLLLPSIDCLLYTSPSPRDS